MKNILSRILIMGSLVALTACGGGGDSTTPPPATTSLIAANSTSIDLQSTDLQGSISTTCYTNNSNGIIETVSISGLTWTYAVKTHTGDTTCANTPSTTTAVATLTIGSNQNVANWVDGNSDPAATPASAADSNINLPTNAPYTVFSGEVTSSNNPDIAVGITFTSGYVIDNSSASGVVLYRVKNTVTGEATTADPYTDIVPVTPPVTTGPDIKVSIDSVVTTGLSTTLLKYTITNTGDTATGDFDVMAWYHRSTAPVYGDAQSGNFNIHSLAAGASQQGSLTINVTLLAGMTFDAYVIADFAEAVGETDEGLTGTNDNLAKQTWTVSDLFKFLNTDFIESSQIAIRSTYDASTDRTTISMRVASGSPVINIVLVGEVTGPGTYRHSDGNIYSAAYGAEFSTYVINNNTPTDTPVTVTITSAGGVGETMYGTYDATLCNVGGSGTCSNTTRYTGSFYIVRDANAP